MGVLRLLGPDQSTLLFDFTAPTGTGNPSSVVTKLGAELDLGTISPVLDLDSRTYGVDLVGNSTPAVEMQIPFTASAATDDALWAGLGQLDRYLLSIARDHPLYLEWTELSSTLYYDIIGATSLVQLLRGQTAAGNVALRKSSLGEIPLRLLRQPWARGASVTTSGVTVPNDPATSTKARVYPITVTGDLPTPGRVIVQMDASSAVERVRLSYRSEKSRSTSEFADSLSDWYFSQTEASARGWTVTLASDTTTASDATASPGSGTSYARTAFTTNPTVMQEKVKYARTTKLQRGSWDVIHRIRPSAANAGTFEVQAGWAPSSSGEPQEMFDPISLDWSTVGAADWVEVNFGTLQLPQSVPLSGLQVRFYARQLTGSGDLDWDFMWIPSSPSATVVVPGGSFQKFFGSQLTTPTNPAGYSAGSVSGTDLVLDTSAEAGGTPPNAGTAFPVGRNRVTIFWRQVTATATSLILIRNITDSTTTASFVPDNTILGERSQVVEFDAVAGKLYQPQMSHNGGAGSVRLRKMTTEFVAALAVNEQARTEPGPYRYGVDKLDGSGNFAGALSCEGEVPVLLQPGNGHLIFGFEDVRSSGFDERKSVLSRTPTVSVVYDPRYAI